MAELQPIIVFHECHFVRHLVICYQIPLLCNFRRPMVWHRYRKQERCRQLQSLHHWVLGCQDRWRQPVESSPCSRPVDSVFEGRALKRWGWIGSNYKVPLILWPEFRSVELLWGKLKSSLIFSKFCIACEIICSDSTFC